MYDVTTLKAGTCEHAVPLSSIDRRLLSLLERKVPPKTVTVIHSVFTSSHRSRARSIARASLLGAIRDILDSLQKDGDRLSYMYSFSEDTGPFRSSGSGAHSGIRMPGDASCFYTLKAGVGRCDLEREGVDEAGRGYVTDVIDCRDKSRLLTENMGEIKIKKRKIHLALPGLLRELESKLTELDCDEISLSYEETPRRP
jgi:hypothetical protein